MLYREIIAVCSQIHTKYINTLCRQNVELLNVKLVVHIVTTGLKMVNHIYGVQTTKSLCTLTAGYHRIAWYPKRTRCIVAAPNNLTCLRTNFNALKQQKLRYFLHSVHFIHVLLSFPVLVNQTTRLNIPEDGKS